MTDKVNIFNVIQFENPNYIFLRITPSTSLRNYNSDIFIPMIAKLYTDFKDKIKIIDNKLHINNEEKLGYYTYIEKDNVQFYFIVPEKHYTLFKDKIIDTWNNRITITNVENIPMLDTKCLKYYMTYKKADALSLVCDKRNNTLLGTQLNILNILEDGDKVGIFYNFIPMKQAPWKASYDNTINDMQNGYTVYHNPFTVKYIARYLIDFLIRISDAVMDAISFSDTKKKEIQIRDLDLSQSTKQKRDKDIAKAQIIIMSQSDNKDKEKSNMISLCNSFQCLNENNTLIYKKMKNDNINLLDTKIKGAEIIKIQQREGQNFISLPSREIIEEHMTSIQHINVLENPVPALLQNGYITLGICECHGIKKEAFFRDNYDQGNLPVMVMGEQGSGKTTYLKNYVKCIQKRNESAVIIDFIKNNELSEMITSSLPKEKVVTLDMSNLSDIQGFGYNELLPKSNNYIDLLETANQKSLYIQMLIDALNGDKSQLSSSMDRYLSAASNITFLNTNASLKDMIKCLNNFEYRNHCIESVPEQLAELLDDDMTALRELNEPSKDGKTIIGTRLYKIDGINHRIDVLKKMLAFKMMFNKSCKDNINLVDEIDQGKIIIIKMPQHIFATPYSKNVLVTYWLTKIWCATLARGYKYEKPKRFHVVIDEVFQSDTAMTMLKEQEILPQMRKFACRFLFSAQDLGQVSQINQTLKSAGASYLFMKGSGKANYNELSDELDPYSLEDIRAIAQYDSLNLINTEEGRYKFVTHLPKNVD